MIDTRYRIYTEALNVQPIEDKVSEHFDSYSIQHQFGYWKHTSENSIVIEILADYHANGSVLAIARWIKIANNQEAVLVTRDTIAAELI